MRPSVWIGVLLLLMTVSAQSQEVIYMGSDEWLPYVGTQEKRGYMIEVADAIFKKRGFKIQITSYPWPRTLQMVRKGSLNAAPGMQKNQAPDFVIPDEPLGIDDAAFFVHQSDPWKFNNIESLNDKLLGIILDSSVDRLLSSLNRYVN